MIPNNKIEFGEITIRAEPNKTYRLTAEEKIVGMIDDLEAIKQAVYLILNIERYESLIYSWNYGIELSDLYGKDIDYVCPEIKRRIEEALLQDERILSIDEFVFESQKGVIFVTFTVHTTLGEFKTEKEVSI